MSTNQDINKEMEDENLHKNNNENSTEVIEDEVVEIEEESGPSFIDKFKTWVGKQNKTVVYSVLGLILLIGGYAAYKYLYQLPREEKASAAIYKTEKFYALDSFKIVLKTAPILADKYNGTKAGEIACYMAGTSYLHTGDFKNAIKYLDKADFKDLILKVQTIGLIGDAYAQLKDFDKAKSQYSKAYTKSKISFTAIHWGIKLAQLHEINDDWKKALEVYNALKEKYSDNQKLQDIDKYIGRAEAKAGM